MVLLNNSSHGDEKHDQENKGGNRAYDEEHQIYSNRVELQFRTLVQVLADVTPLTWRDRCPGRNGRLVLKDDDEEYGTCAKKYDKVKRLIESHWLGDLPLWGCWSGIRAEDGLKNKPRQERRAKEVFGESIYSVRQVVALYHIKRGTWRELSVEYLNLWDVFEGNDDKERRRCGDLP
jgi:hypothetical protein